ncbi:unnamed protein product [Schistocephalus solidus]|uniref:Uncharacterized protein n=1 Tax=Schistocephalus solidus TaxID=70667 RepID=A0A183SMP6_SCHSO|nr:unnamed protein product [Schistocephalus solidus]
MGELDTMHLPRASPYCATVVGVTTPTVESSVELVLTQPACITQTKNARTPVIRNYFVSSHFLNHLLKPGRQGVDPDFVDFCEDTVLSERLVVVQPLYCIGNFSIGGEGGDRMALHRLERDETRV